MRKLLKNEKVIEQFNLLKEEYDGKNEDLSFNPKDLISLLKPEKKSSSQEIKPKKKSSPQDFDTKEVRIKLEKLLKTKNLPTDKFDFDYEKYDKSVLIFNEHTKPFSHILKTFGIWNPSLKAWLVGKKNILENSN